MIEDTGSAIARKLWQTQVEECHPISQEVLDNRVRTHRFRERVEALWGYAVFAVLTAWMGWMVIAPPAFKAPMLAAWAPRAIAALLYLGALGSAILWRRRGLHRTFQRASSAGGSEQPGLVAYGSELEHVRDLRRAWCVMLRLKCLPLVPGYVLWLALWLAVPQYIFPYRVFWGSWGFVFVAALAGTAWWFVRARCREAQQLEREIEELKSLTASMRDRVRAAPLEV